MNMRRLFRAALLATVLTTSACGGTDPVTPTPDAGPIDNGNPDPTPTATDTDGDGLPNAVEDKDADGKVDPGETDPNNRDSDCDGLIDGPNTVSFKGEDQNANGTVDAGETDPLQQDTDSDGLTDGVERGATTNLNPTACTSFVADADPSTTTDPGNPDSDGDGVHDGAEDTDQDGKVDPGELDPKNNTDTTGPAAQVCTTANLRPVIFQSQEGADLKIALPPTFTEVTPIQVGSETRGLVGYDATTKVAFLAFRRSAPTGSSDPLGDEEALRPTINGTGTLSNRTAKLFKTWDGFDASQVLYDQAGGGTDLKRRTDALVNALVPGSTGRLSAGAAGVTGNFRLQSLFVHRSQQSVVVLIALASVDQFSGPAARNSATLFSAKDLSDGSALAQFGEPTAVQCEQFTLPTPKVDFLFVVDDSGSMRSSQLSLAASAQTAVDALNASSLDWRMAMVSSSAHVGTTSNTNNVQKLRKFTRNVNKVKAWLTENSTCQGTAPNGVCSVVPTTPESATCPADGSEGANGGCWVGVSGNGSEGVLGAARWAIDEKLTPGTAAGAAESDVLVRAEATLVVVILADADDQTTGLNSTAANCGTGGDKNTAGSQCVSTSTFAAYFGDRANPTATPTNDTGKHIKVHGIVCPSGSACGCDAGSGTCDLNNTSREFNPQPVQRHATVVNATGGILGSILDTASIGSSMTAIINDVIGNAGYKTLKAPIGASIKVALSDVRVPASCNKNDIPRSTENGFDFDGSARTVSLFGACRPVNAATQAAVSYRYWVDAVKDADGKAPCLEDPKYDPNEADHCQGFFACSPENACVCQAPPSGCPAGQVFNSSPSACRCEVQIG